MAQQCCDKSLQKEVEATIASGILPLDDGRVPVMCSGDTGWQGNGSQMTYNSQSGQTTLCQAQTKKVVAYKFFEIVPCLLQSTKNARETTPNLFIDAQKS